MEVCFHATKASLKPLLIFKKITRYTLNTKTTHRIQSIDLLRGLVILLMALDHVRDYFHYDSFLYDPTDLTQTTVPVFFTRIITHLCAPVFCFLAGTSAFFVGRKKDKAALSTWLLKRGIWLVIVEFTLVNFGWYFKLWEFAKRISPIDKDLKHFQ